MSFKMRTLLPESQPNPYRHIVFLPTVSGERFKVKVRNLCSYHSTLEKAMTVRDEYERERAGRVWETFNYACA